MVHLVDGRIWVSARSLFRATVIDKPQGGGHNGGSLPFYLGRWQVRGANPDRNLIHAFKTIATMAGSSAVTLFWKEEYDHPVEESNSYVRAAFSIVLWCCSHLNSDMGELGSYLLGLNKKTYELDGVIPVGTSPANYKELQTGLMNISLFIACFVGVFVLISYRKVADVSSGEDARIESRKVSFFSKFTMLGAI